MKNSKPSNKCTLSNLNWKSKIIKQKVKQNKVFQKKKKKIMGDISLAYSLSF